MNLQMTRTLTFSAGHRYWFEHLGSEENKGLFGEWASPYNHGHNYTLHVTVDGEINATNGMIVNIKDIDTVLKTHLLPQFVNRSLNDEVGHFAKVAPTVENILAYIWQEIDRIGLPKEVQLRKLKLEETTTLYGEYDGMKTNLTRIYEFASSHRLDAPLLSKEENLKLFGKCNNPAGHGHNYVLEVTVSGVADSRTGMICSIDDLDREVAHRVVDRYDHKNLNEDIPEFAGKCTTSENVAVEIFNRLDGNVPAQLERVRLFETARNLFEVSR